MNSLVPTRQFRAVEAEVVGANDARYYRSLTDEELLDALRQAASNLHSASMRLSEEVRLHLLPALLVLRERYMQPGRRQPIPGKPTYYQVLHSLGLKPDTVRKWFKRTAAADDVLELLGSPRRKRSARPRQIGESDQILLAAADRMAAAVLSGNIAGATRLAREYWEARNS
jgi:hypothetical protein